MKFLVTYQMPHAGLDGWMSLPEDERKVQEQEMQSQWNEWVKAHRPSLRETAGVGKPKRITANGIVDTRNDIMMYSIVEAESLEVAANLFKDHPHFEIPDSWIEVMAINTQVS